MSVLACTHPDRSFCVVKGEQDVNHFRLALKRYLGGRGGVMEERRYHRPSSGVDEQHFDTVGGARLVQPVDDNVDAHSYRGIRMQGHDEIFRPQKRAKEIVGSLKKLDILRVEEEKCTVALLIAPLLGEDSQEVRATVAATKKNIESQRQETKRNFQTKLAEQLGGLTARQRREVARHAYRGRRLSKKKNDDAIHKIRTTERFCELCKKAKVSCECHEKVLEGAKHRDECAVCGDIPESGMYPLVPCGHRVVCDHCLSTRKLLAKCPVVWCRRDIDRSVSERAMQSDYRQRHSRVENRFSKLVDDWRSHS